MADHVSSLVIDSLVAGFAVEAEASAHVALCAQCQATVSSRRSMAQQVLERPEARRRLGLLQSQVVVPAEVPKRPWFRVLAFALPVMVVATVVLRVVLAPVGGGDRVKGSTELRVLREGVAVTQAVVGDQVTLALGSAGPGFLAVVSVDARGDVDIVWPAKGDASSRLEGGANEVLAVFEVTPGSMTLFGFVSDEPVPLESLVQATREAKGETPSGPSGAKVVTVHLDVIAK